MAIVDSPWDHGMLYYRNNFLLTAASFLVNKHDGSYTPVLSSLNLAIHLGLCLRTGQCCFPRLESATLVSESLPLSHNMKLAFRLAMCPHARDRKAKHMKP